MNPTHDWQIDTHSIELVIRRDEEDSVGVRLGHDSIDDAHSTTVLTSRLLEMIDTVQPGAVRDYLDQQEPAALEAPMYRFTGRAGTYRRARRSTDWESGKRVVVISDDPKEAASRVGDLLGAPAPGNEIAVRWDAIEQQETTR